MTPRWVESVEEQTPRHWLEFAVLIAGANVTAGVISLGLVLTSEAGIEVQALMLYLLACSGVAVLLAYYSVMLGASLTIGVLRISTVIASFGLASAQIGMFVLIGATASDLNDSSGMSEIVLTMRHWVLLVSVFGLLAWMSIRVSSGIIAQRIKSEEAVYRKVLEDYLVEERRDAGGALASSIGALVGYLALLLFPNVWALLAIATALLLMMVIPLFNQGRKADRLELSLRAIR